MRGNSVPSRPTTSVGLNEVSTCTPKGHAGAIADAQVLPLPETCSTLLKLRFTTHSSKDGVCAELARFSWRHSQI